MLKRSGYSAEGKTFVFLAYWFVISQLVGNSPLMGQNLEGQSGLRKLENGLTVVLIRKDDAPTITAACGFKAGGVDDPQGFSGTAHLVEHLMARAIRDPFQAKTPFGELSREYSKGGVMDLQKIKDLEAKITALEEQIKGIGLIAATTFDFVYYQGTFSSRQLELFCRMGSELLKGCLPEGVKKERETLLAERKRLFGASAGNFSEQIQALTFGDHPYGRPMAGRPDEVLSITAAVASDFVKKRYVPNNCVLVFVGDLDPNVLPTMVEKYFGNIPRGEEPPPIQTSPPPACQERRLVLEVETRTEIILNFIKPAFPHKDDLVSRVLGMLLMKGGTRGIIEEVAASWGSGERFENAYGIALVPNAGHPPEEVERAFLERLERLQTDPIDEDDLQKAKNEIPNDLDIETQSALQVAITALRYQLIHGDWRLGLRTKELCQGVSANAIREFARKYLASENRTTIVFMKRTHTDAF